MGDHEHPEEPPLPEHVAQAVEAAATALAPNLEGCQECARIVARIAILAALEELSKAAPAPNGKARASRPARKRWRST